MSICLPVKQASVGLLGVTCADVSIGDFTKDIPYLHDDNQAYVFMVDHTWRTLLHPRLPPPGKDNQVPPIFINIEYLDPPAKTLLEVAADSDAVVSETVKRPSLFSRGNSSLDGVQNNEIYTYYSVTKIPGTNFFLGLVQLLNDSRYQITYNTSEQLLLTNQDPVMYHVLDANRPPVSGSCNFSGKLVTTDFSSIVLSPDAFLQPDVFRCNDHMDDTIINNYVQALRNQGAELFLENVPHHAFLTLKLEELWKKDSTGLEAMAAYRFIGTRLGLFRVYPGTQLYKGYDHTKENWYQKAKAYPGQLVVTLVIQDMNELAMAGAAILSWAVTQAGQFFGVMGMAIEAEHFQNLLQTTLATAELHGIYLLDKGGYILYNPELPKSPQTLQVLQLMSDQSKATCFDFAFRTVYHINYLGNDTKIDMLPLQAVEGTNLYLAGVGDFTNNVVSECRTDLNECHQKPCACPFKETSKDYDICNNDFENVAAETKLCVFPSTITRDFSELPRVSTEPICRKVDCTTFALEWMCRVYSRQCGWCEADARTNTKSCTFKASCNLTNAQSEKSSLSKGEIAAIVIVLLAVVATIVVVVALLWRKDRMAKFWEDPDPVYQEPNDYLTLPVSTVAQTEPSDYLTVAVNTLNQTGDKEILQNQPFDNLRSAPLPKPRSDHLSSDCDKTCYLSSIQTTCADYDLPDEEAASEMFRTSMQESQQGSSSMLDTQQGLACKTPHSPQITEVKLQHPGFCTPPVDASQQNESGLHGEQPFQLGSTESGRLDIVGEGYFDVAFPPDEPTVPTTAPLGNNSKPNVASIPTAADLPDSYIHLQTSPSDFC